MAFQVKFPERCMELWFVGTHLQRRLVFFEGLVNISAKGGALSAQLVSAPRAGKGFFEPSIILSSQRLVGPLQPVTGLSVFGGGFRHLLQRGGCRFILLHGKLCFP